MKILIYGAGVVGSTYGWQLSKVGCDVTVLVHKDQTEMIRQNGIHIFCADFRGGVRKDIDTIFKPAVIDELSPDNDFEYIVVSTNNLQLAGVLPILKASAGKAHIIFFQNNWDSFEDIHNYLAPGQYFFGFPFMVGGGRDEAGIHSVISGLKYSNTPLGEVDGKVTSRVKNFAIILEKAGLKPLVSTQIFVWLITHYAVAGGLSAGIMSAGNANRFVKNTAYIKITMKAIREGLAVCRKRGIDARREKANRLYRLPLFISIPIARKIYSNEALQNMFDGHINHSPDEIKQMINDIIESGVKHGVETPNLLKLKDICLSKAPII